jgi:ubiquinone/menaquinone biosynthesis C-methylase UbiE
MERTLEPEVMDTPDEADAYAAMDHSGPNGAFVDRLFELGARGHMLDIGTGPGQIPLEICERDPHATLVAVDLAEHMLWLAEALRKASPHAARIEFRRSDAKALDLPSQSFDAVFSNTLLHHIPDPVPFLREAVRVLRPGGTLLVRDLFRPASAAEAEALVRLHAAEDSEAQRALFRDSLHAALTPEELRAAAEQAGLRGFEVVIDSDRHASIQIAAGARGVVG